MAKSVEEKVVQLTLDNKQFNKASDDTIDSLEKLKKSLEFEGAVDSFDTLEKEIKNVDFSPMEKAIDGVGKSFTILDTITDTIFRNITNRIVDTGARMIKSLSTDQISTGWEKYAEQTGAVQTIMAATAQQFSDTGEQMEVVNEQLEKLTWFTDETSHKFNDMVSGIGKFTANNIDLNTSVKAMEGIATWASLSGANANEASRAIYNLAQAVSVGSVKLIDWRSIENANMGTTEFKQTVIETAKELGTLKEVANGLFTTLDGKGFVSVSNFTEDLQRGWFTADVLLKSLDKYGNFADRLNQFTEETGALTASLINIIDDYTNGTLDMSEAMKITGKTAEELTPWLEELGSAENDLGRRAFKAAQETKTFQEAIDYVKEAVSSGWSTSFKYIFGDYLEAKEWWSEIAEVMYDAFVVGGEIRNTILEMWKDDGGRNDFLDGIREIITNIMDLIDIFKDSWSVVWFGENDENNSQLKNMADLLVRVTNGFLELAKAIKPTETTANNLQRIFKSMFSILKTGVTVIKAIAEGLSPIASLLNTISGVLLDLTASAMEALSGGIGKFFNEDRLNAIANALQVISKVLSLALKLGLIAVLELIENIVGAVQNLFDRIHQSGGGIQGTFTAIKDTVVDFFNAFLEGETIANKVVTSILYIFGGLVTGVKAILDTIIGLVTGELTFNDIFSGNGISNAVNSFGEVLDDLEIADKVSNIVSWLKDFCAELVAADGIIVGFVNDMVGIISFLWDTLKGLLSQLTIDDAKDLLLITILWQFINGINGVNKAFSGAISNFGGIAKSFTDLVKHITDTEATPLDKISGIFSKTSKFLQMGIGVSLLVAALGKLNDLDYERTQQSVAALGVTLVMLLAAMKVLSKVLATFPKKEETKQLKENSDDLIKSVMYVGIAAITIAQAMKVLNETFFDESNDFDWKRYAMIAGGITILMTALAGVTKIMGTIDNKGIGNMVSIISLAAGIRMIAESVKVLDQLKDPGGILAGCAGLSAVLVALGFSVKLMHKTDWKTALAEVPMILAFAAAVATVSVSIAGLAFASQHADIEAALGAVTISIIALAAGIATLGAVLKKTPATTLAGIAVALTGMASAIAILSGVMTILSAIDMTKVNDGLKSLALIFGEMSVALGVLGVTLKSTSPATIISIGFSLIEFAGGIAILTGALKMMEGIDREAINDGLRLVKMFLLVFIGLGVAIAAFDVATVGTASQSLINLSDAFLKFSLAIGILSASVLGLAAASAIMATIVAAFQALAEKVGVDFPTMVERGFQGLEFILHNFLQMILNLAPDLLAVCTVFFGMITLAIQAIKHPTATAVVGIILAIADEIVNHGDELVDALVKLINFINSATELFDALEDLAYHIGNFVGGAIMEALRGLLEGIGGKIVEWIKGDEDEIVHEYKSVYQNALSSLNDPTTDSIVKQEAAKTLSSLIQGWSEGTESDLTPAMIDSGIYAIKKFGEGAGGQVGEEVGQMVDQLQSAVDARKDDLAKAGDTAAGAFHDDGWAKSLDPVAPMDIFHADILQGAGQIVRGVADSLGIVYDAGYDLGSSTGQGVNDALDYYLSAASAKLSNMGLFTGYSKKSTSKPSGVQKKMLELMEDPELLAAQEKIEKETQKKMAESGEQSGYTWADNLASGIAKGTSGSGKGKGSSSSSKSAKEEAKTAAQTIAEAFADELDKISRESQISDKLFQIWKAKNPEAKELEVNAKEIEYQSQKVSIATRKAAVTQEIYRQTLEAMGESAKETHEAYMTMLDDQLALLEAQNKLDELKKDNKKNTDEEQLEAFKLLNNEFKDMYKVNEESGRSMVEFLQSLGATQEDIARVAAKNVGYDMPEQIKDAGNELVESSTNMVEGLVQNILGTLGEGITDSDELLVTSFTTLLEKMLDYINTPEGEGVLVVAGTSIMSNVNDGAVADPDILKNSFIEVINNMLDYCRSGNGVDEITATGEGIMKMLAESMVSGGDGVETSFANILGLLPNVLTLDNIQSKLNESGQASMMSVEEGMADRTEAIAGLAKDILVSLGDNIIENDELLTTSFSEMMQNVLDYVNTGEGSEALSTAGKTLIANMNDGAIADADILKDSFIEIINSMLDYCRSEEGVGEVTATAEGIVTKLSEAVVNGGDGLEASFTELLGLLPNVARSEKVQSSFNDAGESSIESVEIGMTNKEDDLVDTFKDEMNAPPQALKENESGYLAYDEAGTNAIEHIGTGMTENSDALTEAFDKTLQVPVDNFTNEGYLKFEEIGKTIDTSEASGVEQNADTPITSVTNLATALYENSCEVLGITDDSYSSKFYDIGMHIAEGLAVGIEAGQSQAINAAVQMAMQAYQAAMSALQIGSPSRKTFKVGRYFDLGLKEGIDDYAGSVIYSVSQMTDRLMDVADNDLTRNAAIKSLSDLMDIDEDSLHITVVMDADASAVESKMSQIERVYQVAGSMSRNVGNRNLENSQMGYFAERIADSIAYQTEYIADMYSRINAHTEPLEVTVSDVNTDTMPNVSFVQNNYSPKEISRVETYRDTKRQLDAFARRYGMAKH